MVMAGGGRIATGGLALALACGLAAGCSSSSSIPSSPPPAVPGVLGGASGTGGPATGSGGMVVIGGFAPGGAADPAAAGALAYFQWLNARGGVLGREIVYKVLDDRAGAAIVPSLVHQLVQQDVVFALFGAAGTVENLAVASYLNQAGVPDLFAGSVCGCLDAPTAYPLMYGWPLSASREGKVLGAFVAQRFSGQKIGVIYSADQPGKDGLAGFVSGSSGPHVVAKTSVTGAAGVSGAVATLKTAGAQVVVTFAPPDVAGAVGPALARISYQPQLVVAGAAGAAGALPDGTITDSYLPWAGMPSRSAGASWMALFRKIHGQYLPKVPLTPVVIGGMAAAYELATAMFRAGPALTRQSLIAALNGLAQGPAVAPLAYSATDHGGVSGAYVGVLQGGVLVPQGGILIADNTSAGPVTSYQYPQPTAPATGVPPH